VHPEDAATLRPQLERALANPGEVVTSTYRLRHADGSWRFLESMAVSHRHNPAIRAIVINARDVTERHLLEEELRQSQKMEAVGRLAGGIAHDFNNLLAVMLGYTTLTQSRAGDPAVVTRNLEHIRTAAERAASLTRQLLAFSRKQVLMPRVLDLDAVVGELSTMLERMIGEDVQLVTNVEGAKGRIRADRGQMEQVIVNLAVNARDAMPRGGRLDIVLRDVVVAPSAAEPGALRPGRYARLEISDHGVGMDAETLERLFEPFFSTKERGKGTGLGLATVYGIVKQSGGHITVKSAPGQGTTFRIWLPEVEAEAAAHPAATPSGADAVQGSETILLVEDEEAVRSLLDEVLTSSGYRVLVAASGAEALRLSRAHSGPI
jgi:signal transduction histidine kinase